MTTEELLKPRFKCISDFPGNEWFEVGEIYEVGFNGVIVKEEIRKWDDDNYIITQPEKYPAIFLKLNWWEERKLEDMPKYIKWVRFNTVQPVHYYNTDTLRGMSAIWGDKDDLNRTEINLLLPSDEEEYNQYLISLK